MYKCLMVAALTVGCAGAGTFLIKSSDGGRTWKDIAPGPPHQQLLDLQVSAEGSWIYALTVTRVEAQPRDSLRDFAVLASSDGGASWHSLDALGVTSGFAAMAAAPSDAGTVYVSRGQPFSDWDGAPLTVMRTADRGQTVQESSGLTQAMRSYNTYPSWCVLEPAVFGVHPANPATLFMAFDCSGDSMNPFHTFALSRDGGVTWRASSSVAWLNQRAGGSAARPDAGIVALFANPGLPELVYSRNLDDEGRFNLGKSIDGGETWRPQMLRDLVSAALDPRDPSLLLAGTKDGTLWRSSDGAESWDRLGTFLPFGRLLMHPARQSLVLAQAARLVHQPLGTAEIMRSTDAGVTWSVAPTGLDGFSFVFDPRDPGIVYGMAKARLEPRLRAPFVRNLAGGGVLSPGSLFSVYGDDLAGGVTFGGEPAQLLFVSRRQVNGLVPASLKPGPVTVEVLLERAGTTEVDRQTLVLESSAPVILPDSPLRHADGMRPVTPADPARPGERILLHATGLGPSSWVQIAPTDQSRDVERPLSVTPLQDQPGVYEVTIQVPLCLRDGSYPLLFWGGRNYARLAVRE